MDARVTHVIVAVAVGVAAAKLAFVDGPLSGNDRSRWATVRALVDDGTFTIGWRVAREGGGAVDAGLITDPRWRSEDVMLVPSTGAFLSSKPPLLAVLVAGPVWLLARARLTLADDTAAVVRIVLVLFALAPFAWLVAGVAGRARAGPDADGAVVYVAAAAGFGTFASTFTTTLTNHLPAAALALLALDQTLRVLDGRSRLHAAAAGLAAGGAASLELPAGALLAALGALLLARAPATLALFVPAAALPLLAFLGTSLLATGDAFFFATAAQAAWMRFPGSYWEHPAGVDAREPSVLVHAFHTLIGHHGLFLLTPLFMLALVGMARRCASGPVAGAGVVGALVFVVPVAAGLLHRAAGLPIAPTLALAALPGALVLLRVCRRPAGADDVIAHVTLFATSLTLSFIVAKTWAYGGVTAGPRWLLWLTPLLLLSLAPVARSMLASGAGRAVCAALLALSIASAAWPGVNPWQHPWAYRLVAP